MEPPTMAAMPMPMEQRTNSWWDGLIYFVETLQRETEAGSAASGLALAEFNGIGEKLLWGHYLVVWMG